MTADELATALDRGCPHLLSVCHACHAAAFQECADDVWEEAAQIHLESAREYLRCVPCPPACSRAADLHVDYCAHRVADEPGFAAALAETKEARLEAVPLPREHYTDEILTLQARLRERDATCAKMREMLENACTNYTEWYTNKSKSLVDTATMAHSLVTTMRNVLHSIAALCSVGQAELEQRIAEALARIQDLESRLREREAACAKMREALEEQGPPWKHSHAQIESCHICQALSSDAGRNLLAKKNALKADHDRLAARVQKLEEALQWAVIWLDKYPWPAHDQDLRETVAENMEHIRTLLTMEETR